jgi:hypothetical protein
MKKYILALPLLAALLVSCAQGPEGLIVNKSDYTVTFTTNEGTFTLAQGESRDAEIYSNLMVSKFSSSAALKGMVSYKLTDSTGKFSNTEGITLTVNNECGFEITLSAGGYMQSLLVPVAGVNANENKTIYTNEPEFRAYKSGTQNPVRVAYEYKKGSTTMTVTVY